MNDNEQFCNREENRFTPVQVYWKNYTNMTRALDVGLRPK